jgi:hypothetical protein
MYEPYKDGYSTQPNLRKIEAADVFERDISESPAIIAEKKEALVKQSCFLEHDNDPLFYDICAEWILRTYPRPLVSKNYHAIVREADEDFLIHRIKDEKDWLSSAHVCFPSHWKLEDKIGKSFEYIHQPVPMNLRNSRKLIAAAVTAGIFERFVWSIVYDERYNFHPSLPYSIFDARQPRVFVKVERQVTVAFPKHNFCLFVLRQYLIKEDQLDKALLANAIDRMTPEQKQYKGLCDSEALLAYLRSATARRPSEPNCPR